jgi:hypothetical protein
MDLTRALNTPGYMPKHELKWLAEHASRAQRIVEIGSWKGRSTRALADHVYQPGGVVYAIDHWSGQLRDPAAAPERELMTRGGGDRAAGKAIIQAEFNANLADHIAAGTVVPVDWNSQLGLPTHVQLPKVDLLFIDGDHSLVGCQSDIDNFAPLVRKGGILAGHDYNNQPRHRGVREIVDQYFGDKGLQTHGTIWWVEVPR